MINVRRVRALLAGIVLCAAPAARSQSITPATEKYFVNVNVGGQLASRTITAAASKTVYEETATLTSNQTAGRGAVIDFGGGYRITGDIFVGVVISRYSNTETASWSADIPDPLFFNRPKTTTGTTSDLTRTEVGIFPHALWGMPLTDKIDITLAAGVAAFRVKQDLVSDFEVPPGTQNATTSTSSVKGTAVGPYGAVDFIYNWTARYGFGGYVRYAGGKTDLGAAVDQNVGGLQAGGGIRLRF